MLPPLLLSVRVPTRLALFWRAYLAPASGTGSSRRDSPSFLVIRLDGLGDLVLTTPLFRELKRAFPGSTCTVVVRHALRPLLVTNPHVDEVIALRPLRGAWLPAQVRHLISVLLLYWGRLRHRRFDVAISPRWDVDDCLATFLCLLIDAKERVGYTETVSPAKQRHNRGFDAGLSKCLPAGPIQHEVLRNLDIVRALGAKVDLGSLEIRLTPRDREFASKVLVNVPASTRVVAIGIGGSSASRRWPLENYAESLSGLGREFRVQAVIICSREERDDARKLASLLACESIILSGVPLRRVCAVLQCCDLFIGNDNGSAHLAAAMNCKVVVVSRHPRDGDPNHPNSPLRFAPYCDEVRVLQPTAGLDTCRAACHSSRPHCITAVSVERVTIAAREMLRTGPPSMARIQTHMTPPSSDNLRPSIDRAAGFPKKTAELRKRDRSRPADLT